MERVRFIKADCTKQIFYKRRCLGHGWFIKIYFLFYQIRHVVGHHLRRICLFLSRTAEALRQLDFLFFRHYHAQHGPFHVAQRL